MPKASYSLYDGGPKVVTAKWKGGFGDAYKEFTLSVHDRPLITASSSKELRDGISAPLPDDTGGGMLSAQLVGNELHVMRNGSHLPGSMGSPHTKVNNAAAAVFFIAGSNLLFSLIAILFPNRFLEELGMGWITLLVGFIFLALGFGVKKALLPALITALVLYGSDVLLTIVGMATGVLKPNGGGFVMKAILIYYMVGGISAIRRVKEER